MEIIFVSSDQDADAFTEYHKEMTFPAIPYELRELKQTLSKKFEIQGIPSMILIDNQGEQIVMEDDASPRSLITEHGSAAFPLSKEKVQELKQVMKVKQAAGLEKLGKLLLSFEPISSESKEKKEKDVKDTTFLAFMAQYDYVGLLLGDGDGSDSSYDAVAEATKDINTDKNQCSTFIPLYIGWSLYNRESDHGAFSKKFHTLGDVSDELKSILKDVVAGPISSPMMIVLRKGNGECSIDGTCTEAGVPVVVSTDMRLQKLKTYGSKLLPWDDASIELAISAKKARIEQYRSRIPRLDFLRGENGAEKPIIIKSKNGECPYDQVLDDLDDDGSIALYFSAHWCPPCRALTPKLLKCYEELNSTSSDKKKLQVIFVSSDHDEKQFEAYYASMVAPKTGEQWLAIDYKARTFCQDMMTLFEIEGFPTLVLFKKDGTLITKDGAFALGQYGSACYPWTEEAVEKYKEQLTKQEKDEVEAQQNAGSYVVKRVIGEPGTVHYDLNERLMDFTCSFPTAAIDCHDTTDGVLYFEVEIVELEGGGPQYGFAVKDAILKEACSTGGGVGDFKKSWAVDGCRGILWCCGEEKPWNCSWTVGDTIGLAVNVNEGKIAASKNGSWSKDDGCGVVFEDEVIKNEQATFPCITGNKQKLRINVLPEHWKFSPPSADAWTQ